MSNLTMSDVAPYFVSYKAKFNEDCSLTVDVIEQLMEGINSDDELIQAMFEAQHTDDEPGTDDRSPASESDDDEAEAEAGDNLPATPSDTSEGSAYSYAEKMDPAMADHLETLAKAALENKRGAAVIMQDLFRLYGEDTVCNIWPVPGSEADQGRMIGNRLADKFKSKVTKEDGTTGEGSVSWYTEFVRYSARGKELYKQRESLRGIAAKETGAHILPDHKHLVGDVVKTKAERATVDGKINNAKAAIVRAVSLAQRMNLANKSTTMGAELVKEEDGTPVNSNKLIFVFNTEDRTKFDVLTIGQFLALKIEEGKKYSEISGSTRRAPKKDTGPQAVEVNVNTLDMFDKVTAAYATFFDKMEEQTARKEMKNYNALLTRLNAAGSDDLLLSLNKVMNNIEALLSKPGISDRLSKLLADPKKQAA